jgi:serine/threonine-protein kinase
VAARLDRYGADWAAMRREVCEASRGHKQRAEILGLRDACLDRRRGQLHALSTLFAERPDPQVLDKAATAAADLSPIAYCADTDALTARVRPAEDPALRARVAALQPRVDRLEALYAAGKFKEGLAVGEPLLADANAVAYPALRAQVEYWVGRLREPTGDPEGAKVLLRAASVSAAESSDDVLAATAWARLLFVLGERQQRFDEAVALRALGPTVVARAHDERTLALWLNAEGLTLWRMGKFAEAKAIHERVLALRERILEPGHLEIAASLNNLGLVLGDMGDYPKALVAHQRAMALREKALGPDHPDIASSLTNVAIVLYNQGEYAEAMAMDERVLALREKTLGSDHPLLAKVVNNLGMVLDDMGDYPKALVAHQRALAIWEKASLDHPEVADALNGIGRARLHLGQLEEAQALLERARAIREKTQGASHPLMAEPLFALAELSLARQKPREAVPLLERALSLAGAEYVNRVRLLLAEALWQVGDARPRARALAEQARADYERIPHRPGLERATRWLSDHP